MQGDPRYFGGRDSPPQGYGYGYDIGGYSNPGAYYNNGYPSVPAYEDPVASSRRQHDFPGPLNDLEFQASETCPKNYVIFDQSSNKSRVMFHPSLAHRFGSSSYDYYNANAHGAGKSAYRDNDYDEECSIRQKEDTDEIDALLSSEEGEEDDVVSTGRTPGYRDGSSPDSSCSSSYRARASKSRSECSRKHASGSTSNGERKERMKKMVRTLKGIIPGGDQMDTPAVLDEAVRYLKSLKVEVKKLGVRNPDS